MTLKLEDKWVWDFWFAQDGPDYHIFYLQAPRSLVDAELRHWNVSIGHAVSQDLRNWHILEDALRPSERPDDWDSASTWTGSIVRRAGVWHLLYTGASREENGLIQRVGLATSTDLLHWQKHSPGPVLVADPRWYEMLELDMWYDHVWRDPWVFEANGRFHAFITARSNQGHKSARGVIGHASSEDLIHWQVGPPVAAPAEFSYMEVPQLVEIDGRYYLFFCVSHREFAATRLQRPGTRLVTGTLYLIGEQPLGPFRFAADEFLLADNIGTTYAGKALRAPDGRWVFMTARARAADGRYLGEITDPLPLRVAPDGRLRVEMPGQP